MTDPPTSIDIFRIAKDMKEAGIPDDFVEDAAYFGLDNEEIARLIVQWSQQDKTEKVLEKLKLEVSKARDEEPANEGYMSPEQLSETSSEIIRFKAKLRKYVDARGGLARLSEKTDMTVESLGRFFTSKAPPHPETLSEIATALKLNQAELVSKLTDEDSGEPLKFENFSK